MNYELTTIVSVNDTIVDEDSYVESFGSQQELLEFLTECLSMEASRLYDELKGKGDRTFVALDPVVHRSMYRSASGTTRRYGCKPIDGKLTVTARRVA